MCERTNNSFKTNKYHSEIRFEKKKKKKKKVKKTNLFNHNDKKWLKKVKKIWKILFLRLKLFFLFSNLV